MKKCAHHPERSAYVCTLSHGDLCGACVGLNEVAPVSDDVVICVAASGVLDQAQAIDAMERLSKDCSPDDEAWLIRQILQVAGAVEPKLAALPERR